MSRDQYFQGSELRQIPPDLIQRNPENPRLFFREQELDTLTASIRRYGVQVPISVYRDASHYILIDGERRWRCAKKLNLKAIPALIQPKPSALQNLLLMFNIHALREQWDYFTIASKLPKVIGLFSDEHGRDPNEIELSEITGLSRGQIRRCRYLLDLPTKYKGILLKELELPKRRQRITEDFFIEMERSLRTINKRVPSVIEDIDNVRDALIGKFRRDIITNVTDFRKLSKIATSIDNLGVRRSSAAEQLGQIFNTNNNVGIDEIYSEHFELRYDERRIRLNVEAIYEYLEFTIEEEDQDTDQIGEELRELLFKLRSLIDRVLG